MFEEKLIGFDTREMWLDMPNLWNQERRVGFLLKQDTAKPLSVDTAVWPSVCEVEKLHLPPWTGPREGWDNLQRLIQFLGDNWNESWKPHWLVAITEWVDTEDEELVELHAHYEIVPSRPSENWEFLGYDVADSTQTSFLMNAGYTDDEIQPLTDRWARHLNEHHLFDKLDEALGYVDVSYQRDSQHGPFSAYSLYLIQRKGEEAEHAVKQGPE